MLLKSERNGLFYILRKFVYTDILSLLVYVEDNNSSQCIYVTVFLIYMFLCVRVYVSLCLCVCYKCMAWCLPILSSYLPRIWLFQMLDLTPAFPINISLPRPAPASSSPTTQPSSLEFAQPPPPQESLLSNHLLPYRPVNPTQPSYLLHQRIIPTLPS